MKGNLQKLTKTLQAEILIKNYIINEYIVKSV